MSKSQNSEHSPRKPSQEISRRQFLAYALGGTGAFMLVGSILPMVRFAIDPLIQKKPEGQYVKVVKMNKITDTPQEFKYEVKRNDGHHETVETLTAWITKDKDGNIFALSPVCKHLGCMVSWDKNPNFKNQYFCPCHNAHYTKEGKQLAVARAPLDEYKVQIRNGFVYLGDIIANQHVT